MKSQSSKYRLLSRGLMAVLFTGMVAPNVVTAGSTTRTRTSGFTATLSFDGTLGSTETFLTLNATRGQGQSTLFVFVCQNGSCYEAGPVPLTASQFNISDSLNTASLDISGLLLSSLSSNGNNLSTTVDISITWTSFGGPPSGSHFALRQFEGGSKVFLKGLATSW